MCALPAPRVSLCTAIRHCCRRSLSGPEGPRRELTNVLNVAMVGIRFLLPRHDFFSLDSGALKVLPLDIPQPLHTLQEGGYPTLPRQLARARFEIADRHSLPFYWANAANGATSAPAPGAMTSLRRLFSQSPSSLSPHDLRGDYEARREMHVQVGHELAMECGEKTPDRR